MFSVHHLSLFYRWTERKRSAKKELLWVPSEVSDFETGSSIDRENKTKQTNKQCKANELQSKSMSDLQGLVKLGFKSPEQLMMAELVSVSHGKYVFAGHSGRNIPGSKLFFSGTSAHRGSLQEKQKN